LQNEEGGEGEKKVHYVQLDIVLGRKGDSDQVDEE
jgi:hypothetical protein